jgi:hypothetical protein
MIDVFQQLRLFIRVETSEDVKEITTPNGAEILKSRLDHFPYLKTLKARGTLKKETQFISSDRLELRKIVVLGLSGNLHRHLPQGANTVGVSSIVLLVHLMAAGAIVNNFLFVPQITQVSAHHWTIVLVVSRGLSESSNYAAQDSE